MIDFCKLTIHHIPYGTPKRRRGVGTVEEQHRNRQPKRSKKTPRHRIYRPFAGYIRNPNRNSPIPYIWVDNALLLVVGYFVLENWLYSADLSNFEK